MLWANQVEFALQYTLLEYSYGDGLFLDYAPEATVQYNTFRNNNGSGVRVAGP